MTIKEKAERYDELLKKLQEAKEDNNVCDERYCCVIDDIVPELKESEDERIRKGLIDFVNQYGDNFYGQISKEYAIAWLEKQGKQIPDNSAKTCKDEQEPTDKVEPKFKVGDVMRTLQEAADNITSGLPVVVSIDNDNEYYRCTNELIAIKDQDDYEYPPMNRRQRIAWSAQDDLFLLVCKNALEKYQKSDNWDANIIIDWLESKLKSLKPQNRWKPTKRQLESLEMAAKYYMTGKISKNYAGKDLTEILEQLKAL